MALYYLAAFLTSELGAMSVVISGTAGSGTATLTPGRYAHVAISKTGLDAYTALAAAVDSALDAAVAGFTVSFDAATQAYTISHASTFTLTWTGDAGARLRKLLGFSGTLSGANSYTSDVRPYFAIVPSIAGRSKFSDVYVPDETVSEASADDGTTYGIGKERTADPMDPDDEIMHSDWQQAMEPLAAVMMRSAAASAPWTWEHFFKHALLTHPFTVTDGATTTVHTLREEGAGFTAAVRQRVVADYDGLWSMNFLTRQYP